VKFLRSLLLAFLLGSSISVLGEEPDQAKPDESVLDVIADRESQYIDGLLHRNFEELASVLADTYVNTSPFGSVRDKAENWLAGVFSRAAIKRMERQTARLKRLRIERKMRGRNDDDFKVA